MKISKNGNQIILSELSSDELFGFLKCQIFAKVSFSNDLNLLILMNREKHTIHLELNDKKEIWENEELLKYFSDTMKKTNSKLSFVLSIEQFTEKEPLIMICGNIRKDILSSCKYIDYTNNVFEICNQPFTNGDSDKMYYFELNDTLLAFSENGPILITDNPNINSIEDVICDI